MERISDIVPETAERDFTASAFVVKQEKVLLLKHVKSGLWLQPGGHIENNELPHETAIREAKEETGFSIRLVSSERKTKYNEEAVDLPLPFRINTHKIKDGHWHCDLGYLAEVKSQGETTHAHEREEVGWFSRERLNSGNLEIAQNTRQAALAALEEMKER